MEFGQKHNVLELNFAIAATLKEAIDKNHSRVFWFFKSVQERDAFVEEIKQSNKYEQIADFKCNKVITFN